MKKPRRTFSNLNKRVSSKKQEAINPKEEYTLFPKGNDKEENPDDDREFFSGLQAMIGVTSDLIKTGEIKWNLGSKTFTDNTVQYVLRKRGG
jgi:hypothetical protein